MKTVHRPGTAEPSERISWERCPVCGATAAVGWGIGALHDDRIGRDEPVEFDCPSGCHVTPAELHRAFGWRSSS
ncbi:MAG: hypothetical protein ACXV3S_08210 [Kineosporiaceae bacterium]